MASSNPRGIHDRSCSARLAEHRRKALLRLGHLHSISSHNSSPPLNPSRQQLATATHDDSRADSPARSCGETGTISGGPELPINYCDPRSQAPFGPPGFFFGFGFAISLDGGLEEVDESLRALASFSSSSAIRADCFSNWAACFATSARSSLTKSSLMSILGQ